MRRLYDFLPSGNCYKLRLLMSQLRLPYERIDVNILAGETQTEAFLARNPNGRVPVLELENGQCLAESNAILWYLASGTSYLPSEKLAQAQVLQWMFFEQYSHEPYIATSRYWISILGEKRVHSVALEEKKGPAHHALGVMERHLGSEDFFVANRYTIADIALYAYTHVAEEGEFDLSGYPQVRAWLARVAQQPGYIPITMET